jgi:glutathione S-transferase
MTLVLHYAPVACSLVPYVALTEAGAPFEVRAVDFSKGKHLTAEFLHLNPKHKVPVLVIDGEPLTENVAILQWIAQRYPAAQLLPPCESLHYFNAVAFLAWCASGTLVPIESAPAPLRSLRPGRCPANAERQYPSTDQADISEVQVSSEKRGTILQCMLGDLFVRRRRQPNIARAPPDAQGFAPWR